MNITNWGILGSLPKSQYPMENSPSAQWPAGSGIEYLYAAGLWVGARVNGIPAVSTGYPETEFYPPKEPWATIYTSFEGKENGNRPPGPADDDQDGLVDEDWLNGLDDDEDGLIDEDYAAVGAQMFSCWYTDDQVQSTIIWPEHTPMNLHIRQETYQWADDDFNDFVGVHYLITNNGSNYLTDVYLGLYVDVDAGPRHYGSYHMDDQVGCWTGSGCAKMTNGEKPVRIKMVYGYDDDGDRGETPGYFGIAILGYPTDPLRAQAAPFSVEINAFKIFKALIPYVSGGDPTNDFERYDVLSNRSRDKNTEIPNDYRMLVSMGPFNMLAPDSSLYLDIAFVCGEGLDGMLQAAANAMLVYQGYWYDADNDPLTGVDGRESPAEGPLMRFDPDPCDDITELLYVPKHEIIWSNLDCNEETWGWLSHGCYKPYNAMFKDYQTGVDGRETQIHWITGSAPPIPKMRVVPGDNRVTLFWDNLSEVVPDPLTRKYDFEGYQIWRAADWHRPLGTSVFNGPSNDLWGLIATGDIINDVYPDIDFKKPYSEGGWQYTPLIGLQQRDQLIKMFEESIIYAPLDTVPCPPGVSNEECDTLEALARHNLGYEGGRQYYKYVDTEPKNGMPYFYSVVSYDHEIVRGHPVRPGKYNTPASNFVFVSPRTEARSAESYNSREVYVVPNPVTTENMEPWRMEPNNDDPSGLKLEFQNLPRCRVAIRIFTVFGDLVQVLHHDGRNGAGSKAWNLISRNGQDITSGVYLFSVDPEDGRFSKTIGKFVVIR
ncbi:MAG: hypothetical protein JSV33_02795 [bacterium]|nr:MAG: hypothetical protein JSV33_02795 [bacterium]